MLHGPKVSSQLRVVVLFLNKREAALPTNGKTCFKPFTIQIITHVVIRGCQRQAEEGTAKQIPLV